MFCSIESRVRYSFHFSSTFLSMIVSRGSSLMKRGRAAEEYKKLNIKLCIQGASCLYCSHFCLSFTKTLVLDADNYGRARAPATLSIDNLLARSFSSTFITASIDSRYPDTRKQFPTSVQSDQSPSIDLWHVFPDYRRIARLVLRFKGSSIGKFLLLFTRQFRI